MRKKKKREENIACLQQTKVKEAKSLGEGFKAPQRGKLNTRNDKSIVVNRDLKEASISCKYTTN